MGHFAPRVAPKRANSKFQANKEILYENFKLIYKNIGFKNSGLTLEFCLLVGIGRSGVVIGSLCLNMVPNSSVVTSYDQKQWVNCTKNITIVPFSMDYMGSGTEHTTPQAYNFL